MKKRIITIIFIAFSAYLFIDGIYQHRTYDMTAAFPSGISVSEDDKNEYIESLRDIPSDIDGMSLYDKHAMGLSLDNGSDTDHDGLSDKAEIEIYGTDPLNTSTAGDLYTDGYKVSAGLDPLSYLEYDSPIVYENNTCSNIRLSADDPADLTATVYETTDRYNMANFGIETTYAGYYLYGYDGPIDINISLIVPDEDREQLHVWMIDGDFIEPGLSELQEAEFEIDGNTLTLTDAAQSKDGHFIYLTNERKRFTFSSLLPRSSKNNYVSIEKGGLIYGSIIMFPFFTCVYTDMDTAAETEELRIKLYNICKDNIGIPEKYINVKKVNAVEFQTYKAFVNNIPQKYNYNPNANPFNLYNILYMVYSTDSIMTEGILDSEGTDILTSSTANSTTGFDMAEDSFLFPNFSSEVTHGAGNCAGITHFISYLYNNGYAPSSGSYDCYIDGEYTEINWDISIDRTNDTLTDPGVADYKDAYWVKHRSKDGAYLDKNITTGEKEFINMIGSYWVQSNDNINLTENLKKNGQELDWSVIDHTLSYLDSGRVAVLYMLMNEGYGHAVNVYGYKWLTDDELLLYVYDSNIPQDKVEDAEMTDDHCTVRVKCHIQADGSATFSYVYYPIMDRTAYVATTQGGVMQENIFLVTDENWNIL